jgi:hypothetical protein
MTIKVRQPFQTYFELRFYSCLESWNPDVMSVEEFYSGLYLLGLEMIRRKETQLNGLTILVDGENFSFKQARQYTPRIIRTLVDMIVVGQNITRN